MDNDNDILILNDMPYTFEVSLFNSGGAINLPKTIFRKLSINESFIQWGIRGYLIYDNSFEQLERYKANSKQKNTEFFYFRMDGTDRITIKLTPVLNPISNRAIKMKTEFPVDILSLHIECSIYDTEDLSQDTIERKEKKLYFWSNPYNTAINTNTRVSSGGYLKTIYPKVDITTLNNSNKRAIVSDLLKFICTDKLGEKVSDKWASCTNKFFYISPPSSNIWDDIEYLLRQCFDDDGYPPHFYYDRFKNEFNLKSYRVLFENYKTELKERIQFSDPTKPNTGIVPIRSDLSNTFHLPMFSDILSYKYSKMAGLDSMRELNSRIVSGYDGNNKKFLTNVEDAHIETAKGLYKKLLSTFPEGSRTPLMILNDDKISNKNPIEEYAYEPKSVVQRTLEASLLLNDSIHFKLLGLPNRTPGTFIELSSDTDTQGIWEDRFLGTWLVTTVTHEITPSGYTNDILAVKPNMADALTYPTSVEIK